jgi:uncharacterized membrane protein YebE (DUF533 family)
VDGEDILNGLLRGALGGRRRPWGRTRRALGSGSLVNAGTLLAAAGVAWGLYETWQGQRQRQAAAATPGPATQPPLPVVNPVSEAPAGEPDLPAPILRLLRLMISAARADGEIAPAEREQILAEAREVGAAAAVEHELAVKRPLAEVVEGAEDAELKEQMYALAYTIVRADQAITGSERIYLAQLASKLGLDAAAVGRLEGEVVRRIDATAGGA